MILACPCQGRTRVSFQVSHVCVFVLSLYIIDQSSVLKLLKTTEMFWLSNHTHTHTHTRPQTSLRRPDSYPPKHLHQSKNDVKGVLTFWEFVHVPCVCLRVFAHTRLSFKHIIQTLRRPVSAWGIGHNPLEMLSGLRRGEGHELAGDRQKINIRRGINEGYEAKNRDERQNWCTTKTKKGGNPVAWNLNICSPCSERFRALFVWPASAYHTATSLLSHLHYHWLFFTYSSE